MDQISIVATSGFNNPDGSGEEIFEVFIDVQDK